MLQEARLEHEIHPDVKTRVRGENLLRALQRRTKSLASACAEPIEIAARASQLQVGDRVRALAHHDKSGLAGDHHDAGIEKFPVESRLVYLFFDLRAFTQKKVDERGDAFRIGHALQTQVVVPAAVGLL